MRLVPDELWVLVEPLVREFRARRQGGGTAPLPARAVFTAIEYVLTSGCSWRDLPPSFGGRTGPASSLMRHRCVRKGGIADRAEPGRPRQARFEDPRHVRTRWGAAVVGVSAANTNDSYAFKPLVKAIPAIRSRRRPRRPRRREPGKLHADKAYDTSEKLGRHRWVG